MNNLIGPCCYQYTCKVAYTVNKTVHILQVPVVYGTESTKNLQLLFL